MTFGENPMAQGAAAEADQASNVLSSVARRVTSRTAMLWATGSLAVFSGGALLDSSAASADTCFIPAPGLAEVCIPVGSPSVPTPVETPTSTPSTPDTAPTPDTTPTPVTPEPTSQPTEQPSKRPKKQKHTSTATSSIHFDFNMHDWGPVISGDGCGVISLADSASYALGRSVKPPAIKGEISQYYSASGAILASPYMAGAAPKVARDHHLREYQTLLSTGGAAQAIRNGGAIIMLATGGSDSIITHASHYFESDQLDHGNFIIHDPNQKSDRTFDKSRRSAGWLTAHQTEDRVWVLAPYGH